MTLTITYKFSFEQEETDICFTVLCVYLIILCLVSGLFTYHGGENNFPEKISEKKSKDYWTDLKVKLLTNRNG